MTRKKIPAAQLHDLLSDALRKTAGDHCLRCGIPMPRLFESGASGPNWRIGGIEECSTLCHSILEDLVRKFSARYDIAAPGKR